MESAYKDFEGVSWITVPESEFERVSCFRDNIHTAYFRKEFFLEENAQLKIHISANSRYRLWVNGRDILSGPLKGDRWSRYYETLDVSEYLQTGKNVLAVKVVSVMPSEYGLNTNKGPDWLVANAAGPCLIVSGKCVNQQNEVVADISTGVTEWKAILDEAVKWSLQVKTHWLGSMEIVDGSKIPENWSNLQGCSDNWPSAVKKWDIEQNPWGILDKLPLKRRTVELLFEKKRDFIYEPPFDEKESVFIDQHSTFEIILNAGELTTGYFKLITDQGAGSKIEILYAESYAFINKDGRIEKSKRDDAALSLFGHYDTYYPSGRKEIYQPFFFRTFRYIKLVIKTGDQPLVLYRPYYIETGYPLNSTTTIASSEKWMEEIWGMSVRTLQRCMHETYEDCPYYEQLQYIADTRLQILFTYCLSMDHKLAEKAIYDFHCSLMPNGMLSARYPTEAPHIIPQWTAHWIFMVEDYYWQTGDVKFLKKYRPTIDAILEYYDRRIGDCGLVEYLGYWDQVDWIRAWKHGVSPASEIGPSTVQNLVYCNILKSAANINRVSGRIGIAEEYENRAKDIFDNLQKYCWSDNVNMFREGPECYEYSQHAQMWAVLTGYMDTEKANKAMDGALNYPEIRKCTYPFQFYLFRALEKLGRYSETERLFDQWKELIGLSLTTLPETPSSMTRSDCHAWSALPIYEFTRSILGVRPLKPGWDGILIKPVCFYVSVMSGNVTTPRGIVGVNWSIRGNTFRINVSSPEGVPVKVIMPDQKEYEFINNGEIQLTCKIG